MIRAAIVVNVAAVMAAAEAEIVADVVTAREAMPVVVKAVGMAIVVAEVSAAVVMVDAVTRLRAANRRAVATLLVAEIDLDVTRVVVAAIRRAANLFVAKVDPSVNKLRVKQAIETKAARVCDPKNVRRATVHHNVVSAVTTVVDVAVEIEIATNSAMIVLVGIPKHAVTNRRGVMIHPVEMSPSPMIATTGTTTRT
jgi:hypothetical protein